jgi:hypothetical protein
MQHYHRDSPAPQVRHQKQLAFGDAMVFERLIERQRD